jgi:hypothetical protein
MLERFWAAWESQKRIDSQRYQARALRHLQPPVREPICGLDGLGFLKSFFVVLTEKDMTPSANTPRTSFSRWWSCFSARYDCQFGANAYPR